MSIEDEIAARLEKNAANAGSQIGEFIKLFPLSMAWIEYYWPMSPHNNAVSLLVGSKISLLESGASWSVGSNRGAAASLRTYVENIISWFYYREHPVEFRMVSQGIDDLWLPKAVISYASKIDPTFEKHHSALFKSAIRETDYYYGTISGYIHAHPKFTNSPKKLAEIVVSVPVDPGFSKICKNTDEFISDFYATVHRKSWDTVPDVVKLNVSSRLDKKLAKFLSE